MAIREALIALFESPIPDGDAVGKAVLAQVLGNPAIDYDHPILEFANNPHLSALSKPGVPSIVWETSTKRANNVRTVLDPITTEGHELLLEFIGKSYILLCTSYISLYVQMLTSCR
jgi:hypothetical protein